MLPLATFIQHSIGNPRHGNERRQINKGIQIGKEEVNLSLFAHDRGYIQKNPKDTTRKLLELIDEFGKIAGYKIYIQKFVAFLYTNNEESEREIKETIPFTMTSKSIKYLEINVPKEVKDLYLENCETPPLRQKVKRK